ncbi:FAD binding domain-containing protein [Mycobacterium xenopi RIVM700367]|nr:FAD binding domain-containing protein [Mycobacterium xenopi RIVM700367]
MLVVGAGAAGLATSAVLAQHGVRSLLVEKRRETFVYPKARNLSFRSLEILRGLGLGDEVHAVAEHVSEMISKPALNSAEEYPGMDVDAVFGGLEHLSPEPTAQYCPQSRLEPILLAAVRRHGNDVRYATELSSFECDDTGVTAILRDVASGESQTVRAGYLVAADGVRSPVRESLGVTTSGYGAVPIFFVFIYFRAPWRQFVPHLGDGDAVQVQNPDVEGIFVVVQGDLGVFMTTYFPDKGETAEQFTRQRCAQILTKAIGQRIDLEIVDVATWQPYEQVADQFQCGRVFFVGDSGHTMPPFKGGGANAAIQSAHNLAWKLAAVLNRIAEPGLLATYDAERRPVGRFSARQSLTGPSLAFLRLDENRPRLPPEDEAPMFALLVGYQYRSAAVVSDKPIPTDPDSVSLVDDLRGQPGTRVPHVWVRRNGKRLSTLDLLGPRFTLLTGDDGTAWSDAAVSVSTAMDVPIRLQRIGSAVDAYGAWAATTGLAPDGALLVRPDDFVGWRADGLPADPKNQLRKVMCQVLGRRQ